MSRRSLWQRLFVREVLVAVPMEIPKPIAKPDEDPRFLREMAESFAKSPVVYENLNDMIKRRRALLDAPPPTTSQADRDSMKWRKDQAAIEVSLLSELFLAPRKCAEALNALAQHKKEVRSEDHSNWTPERISQ